MAYATTVYPARAALQDMLNGWSWPDGAPTIRWGAPTELTDQHWDMVYQRTPESPEDEYTVLGGLRIDENYELIVLVDVHRYGDDEQATEARVWSHFNQIVQMVHQDGTLQGTVNRVTGVRFEPGNVPAGQQWHSRIAIRIAVVGYVNP